ncbi:hypothetical protein NFJ02_17g28820 [Pycnococcus provasolii]
MMVPVQHSASSTSSLRHSSCRLRARCVRKPSSFRSRSSSSQRVIRARSDGSDGSSAVISGFAYLSKAEIPSRIPRSDFMKQMFRWAVQEYESAAGRENYGLPMEVKAEESEEGEVTAIVVDVKGVTTLRAQMDDEEVQVFDTVSKDKEGNAIPAHSMGKTVYEQGRYFVISRIDTPIEADRKPTVRAMLENFGGAVNAYYAFGSPFSTDET